MGIWITEQRMMGRSWAIDEMKVGDWLVMKGEEVDVGEEDEREGRWMARRLLWVLSLTAPIKLG